MRTRRVRRPPMSQINVVPYIDVMLVLLVIFMITAPLLSQGVVVELPRMASEPLPTQKEEPLIVSVNVDGKYFVNVAANPDVPIEAEELYALVAAVLRRREGTPVYVRGDADANYGQVVKAMAVLQAAGAPNVGLMTEPLPPGPR